MSSLNRALIALALVGLAAGAMPFALALVSEGGHQRQLLAVIGPITGWAFVSTGLFVWWRRPESSFGAMMTAVGFSACAGALRVATEPLVFITGLIFIVLPYAVLYHMLLAFPTGRLQSGHERLLVAISYLSAIVVHPFQVLFQDTRLAGFPENPLLITASPEMVSIVARSRYGLGVLLITLLAVMLIRRWHAAGAAYRRRLFPVLLSGGVVFMLFGIWYAASLLRAPAEVLELLERGRVVTLAVVPFGFLTGLLHSRVAGALAVGELIARFGDPLNGRRGLRDALADALEDPSLALAYWLPGEGRYVDIDGHAVTIPDGSEGRTATIVEREGRRVAAFIHEAALSGEPESVRAAAAAVGLALDNERLQAELRARLEELRTSRARIVHAADTERRRIERNLHDGTQQRLTLIAMALGLTESRLRTEPDAALASLRQARISLGMALSELRDLSQGIHPGILTERGLKPAIEDLVYAAVVPVTVKVEIDDRLPEAVEAAAYYVVAEALANVAKHAAASMVTVELTRENRQLSVQVTDNGRGGADPALGTGLRGLTDRLGVLGGVLTIEGSPGSGTYLRAVIPCA